MERAVIQELADRLDRLARVTSELGGGVAQDMDAAERHAGRSHVPLEPGVERARRDPRCPRTRLPERLRRLHRGEVPAGVRQRDANGLVGRAGQFPAPEMVTLTNILVADTRPRHTAASSPSASVRATPRSVAASGCPAGTALHTGSSARASQI